MDFFAIAYFRMVKLHCMENSVSHYSLLGEHAYAVEDDVLSIQKEILTHGPVEASFEVYEDFLTYGSGVYKVLKSDKQF